MSYETLLYEVADQVATITLNRPAKMNSFTPTMGQEIAESMLQADADRNVRVIIMTGAGDRAFCAGADIGGFARDVSAREGNGDEDEFSRRRGGPALPPLPTVMRNLSKPTIAAINGYALGVGLTIPILFDVRISSENAKMGTIFGRVGVMAELGSTYLLPRMIGFGCFRNDAHRQAVHRRRMPRDGPHQSGHAGRASDDEMARELANEMLQCSPTSLAYTEHALHQAMDGTLETAMQLEMFASKNATTARSIRNM